MFGMTYNVAANSDLLEAARTGKLRDAKRAVKNRADVACRDENGSTPLMLAARRGDVEIVDLLAWHKNPKRAVHANHGA